MPSLIVSCRVDHVVPCLFDVMLFLYRCSKRPSVDLPVSCAHVHRRCVSSVSHLTQVPGSHEELFLNNRYRQPLAFGVYQAAPDARLLAGDELSMSLYRQNDGLSEENLMRQVWYGTVL